MKARACKTEQGFRYPLTTIVEAARLLSTEDRKIVVGRLADRKTWDELALVTEPLRQNESNTREHACASSVKRRFRILCGELICYLDSKHGRGIIPGVGKLKTIPQETLTVKVTRYNE